MAKLMTTQAPSAPPDCALLSAQASPHTHLSWRAFLWQVESTLWVRLNWDLCPPSHLWGELLRSNQTTVLIFKVIEPVWRRKRRQGTWTNLSWSCEDEQVYLWRTRGNHPYLHHPVYQWLSKGRRHPGLGLRSWEGSRGNCPVLACDFLWFTLLDNYCLLIFCRSLERVT